MENIEFSKNEIIKKAAEEVLKKGEYVFCKSEISELEEYYSPWTSFNRMGFELKQSFGFYIDGSDKYTLELDSLKNLSEEHFRLWLKLNNAYNAYGLAQGNIIKTIKQRYFPELYHYLKNKGVDFSKVKIDTGFCYQQQNIYSIYKNELTYMDYDWENPELEVWNTGGDFLVENTKLLTDEEVLEYIIDEIYKNPNDFDDYPKDFIQLILDFIENELKLEK